MGYRQVMKMIWCEHCRSGPWRHVNGLMWKCEVVVRSGSLKLPPSCNACKERFEAGEWVEAVALNIPEPGRGEWLRKHVRVDDATAERPTGKQHAA